jgi:hypothetical protein
LKGSFDRGCWTAVGERGRQDPRAINGKSAIALEEASNDASLGARHRASLTNQAAAASAFDEAGRKVGVRTGKVIDGANRAKENLEKEKKDQQ